MLLILDVEEHCFCVRGGGVFYGALCSYFLFFLYDSTAF
jgi:hypothetical protein